MVKATKSVNYIRDKLKIPPIKIDAEKAQAAQDFLIEHVIGKSKGGTRRRLEETKASTAEAATSGCGQNIYESKDANVDQVTTDMAVAQWYKQREYYNFETGEPTDPKHKEDMEEYVQVVYKDTESVGFGIVHPFVVGWYCPKAVMDANTLKQQV